jgi:hypothetical protein
MQNPEVLQPNGASTEDGIDSSNEADTLSKSFPSPVEFYLKHSLYELVEVAEGEERSAWHVEFFKGSIDSYCPECGAHSIYERISVNSIYYELDKWIKDHLFELKFQCTRDRSHQLYFLFKLKDRKLQKIGQFPSVATLNLYDVKKYSKALDKRYYHEFTKAIGLAAHGIGVGSFVYLRRIFEYLIEQAHGEALASAGWNDEQFQKSRMLEKIQLLSQWLPVFLVQNKSMYGILSKGVHELTEEECLSAFPIVKVGIEIILDARIHEMERKRKLEEAQKAIQSLVASPEA